MKKARFIGVLMAIVMAAVPFAGNAKTSFNSLNANADYWINDYVEPECKIYHRGIVLDSFDSRGYTANQCGFNNPIFKTQYGIIGGYNNQISYDLVFINGYIKIVRNEYKDYAVKPYMERKVVWSFYTGGFTLGFQIDGNLVAYDIKGNPTAHTCTYNTNKTTKQGYKYQYVLTKNGTLQIWRFSSNSHNGEIIWDSSRNTMYRI